MNDKESNSEPVIEVIHFADPWCWWSWGLEPIIQRLKAVYGDQIQLIYKMGGALQIMFQHGGKSMRL
jgi:protein-disulfide isomerase-like protein with CxxC motif